MATPSLALIEALRTTAERINHAATPYQWTHQGSCNCGHLAQTITALSKADIHAVALEKPGEWTEHLHDYCPISAYKIDAIITAMLDMGLTRDDIAHLEKLSSPYVLQHLSHDQRKSLAYNRREDVALYLHTFANTLEQELLASISIRPDIQEILQNNIPRTTAQNPHKTLLAGVLV
jgi:hypothetical protein